ncbi:hypothetical protein [Streptomyces sp. NPDC005953]|uniref:hypothetical protein n=1 Tax=unclassified Streptomyces TaxID=2593676 RepID=UPI0033FE12E5
MGRVFPSHKRKKPVVKLFRRRTGKQSKSLPALLTALGTAALILGAQSVFSQQAPEKPEEKKESFAVLPAAAATSKGFHLTDALWTTAHIRNGRGVIPGTGYDTGVVVSYISPANRNPETQRDWIGIHPHGNVTHGNKIDWDWVCPNENDRCTSFGAAAIGAGSTRIKRGEKYTIAYWRDEPVIGEGTVVATIDFVAP